MFTFQQKFFRCDKTEQRRTQTTDLVRTDLSNNSQNYQRFCFLFLAFSILILGISTAPAQNASASGEDSQTVEKKPDDSKSPPKETAEQMPRCKLLRAEEDWSFLADEKKRDDYLDPIKYIRLRENHPDWFLTLGGEIRPFYENYRNENFGASTPDKNGYLLQRFMFHANLRLGRRFRFFAQIKSGLVGGKRGAARPPDKDKLDFNQAFAEFSFGLRDEIQNKSANEGEQNKAQSPRFNLRIGRQELDFGSGRLVSVREGPNVRQGFDGVRLISNIEKWRVDAFAVKPVNTPFGVFDDAVNSQTTFWGVYAVRPFNVLPKLLTKSNIDVYYFGIDRKNVRFDQGAGREIRHTIGARFWNKAQSFDYDVEFAGQFGRFGAGQIRAAFVSTNLGYTFKNTRFQPRIGFAGGINSGDKNPNAADLQTFSPPFPRGKYFGQIGANGPNNIAGFSPGISLKLLKNVTVAADNYVFFRQSLNDGLYGVPGNLLRSGATSHARFVGTQPQIEAVWQIDRHFSYTVNYARFFAGSFIKDAPPSRDVNYFATWLTYKF